MSLSKKLLSFALAVIMIFPALSVTAFAEESEVKIIDSVDVTIDFEDIVNEPVADFINRISVEQEGLRIGTPAVTKAGSTFLSTETFEPGQKYWLSLCCYVEDGYNVEGYTYQQGGGRDIPVSINGENLDFHYQFDMSALTFNDKTYCVYPQHYTENGDQRICLSYSFTVPENPSFFEKIAQAFEKFFEPIVTFFTKIIAQPIAELIEMFS